MHKGFRRFSYKFRQAESDRAGVVGRLGAAVHGRGGGRRAAKAAWSARRQGTLHEAQRPAGAPMRQRKHRL